MSGTYAPRQLATGSPGAPPHGGHDPAQTADTMYGHPFPQESVIPGILPPVFSSTMAPTPVENVTVESVRTGAPSEIPGLAPPSVPLSVPFSQFTSLPGIHFTTAGTAAQPLGSFPAQSTLLDPIRVLEMRMSQIERENASLKSKMTALQHRVADQTALLLDLVPVICLNREDLNRLKERVSVVNNQVHPSPVSNLSNSQFVSELASRVERLETAPTPAPVAD